MNKPVLPTSQTQSTIASCAVVLTAAAGHNPPGLLIAAAAVSGGQVLAALARQLFWLRVLDQPARDLRRLIRQTGSDEQAKELFAELCRARQAVLTCLADAEHRDSGAATGRRRRVGR